MPTRPTAKTVPTSSPPGKGVSGAPDRAQFARPTNARAESAPLPAAGSPRSGCGNTRASLRDSGKVRRGRGGLPGSNGIAVALSMDQSLINLQKGCVGDGQAPGAGGGDCRHRVP